MKLIFRLFYFCLLCLILGCSNGIEKSDTNIKDKQDNASFIEKELPSEITKMLSKEYPQMMSEEDFWAIIEFSGNENPIYWENNDRTPKYYNHIIELLKEQPQKVYIKFERRLRLLLKHLDKKEVLDIFAIDQGLFTLDDFIGFKCWIIAHGKRYYYAYLREGLDRYSQVITQKFKPDCEAGFRTVIPFNQGLIYTTFQVCWAKYGKEGCEMDNIKHYGNDIYDYDKPNIAIEDQFEQSYRDLKNNYPNISIALQKVKCD